jgi:hypothetical protein
LTRADFGAVNCRIAKGSFDHSSARSWIAVDKSTLIPLGGLEVDHQLEFDGLLNRQIALPIAITTGY